MQTECPHCHTIFHVEEALLEQADGQVRCGHCLAIFTADNPYNTVKQEADHAVSDDATVESSDELAAGLDFDTHETIADVIPPELRAESRRKGRHSGWAGTFFITLAILASIAAGFLQYAYYNRENLQKISSLRPWLQLMCKQLNCTLPPLKDSRLIVLTSKNIFTHPNVKDALMVTASIVNQADFAQDYPIIELRFENVRGQTIAARRFYAREYLGIPENQISQMQPNTSVSIKLEIKDPGSEMVSYEFDFL